MKKLRFIIVVAVVVSLLLSSGVPAFAFGPNESRSVENFFIDAQILKGGSTGAGYGLEKTASRLEGIVILIRMMGKETEAQNLADQPCHFTDVPDWAKGYVNFAYDENISKGTGGTVFGVNDKMTADQYNTLMLRVLGYDDSKGDFNWEDSVDKARKLSILPRDMANGYTADGAVFTKGDLMENSFCYLEANFKDQQQTLIDSLIEGGVIPDGLAEEYGLAVKSWDSLTTSLSPDEYYVFSLDGWELTVSGRSSDSDKQWILVQLVNKDTGKEKTAKVDNRNQDGEYDFPVSLANLQEGEYYVNLYANDEKYNTYKGLIHSEVVLKITAKDASFIPSPAYGENVRIYKGDQVEAGDGKVCLVTRADKQALEEVNALAAEITKDCSSDYDKIRAVHDWVAKNLYYDNDSSDDEKYALSNITPRAVLESRVTVCSGYAILARDLLAAAGVPCKLVFGYALGESDGDDWSQVDLDKLKMNHAWNEAYADGRWVIFDATWDSTNTYESGKFSTGDQISHAYFDCTVQYFSDSHKEME